MARAKGGVESKSENKRFYVLVSFFNQLVSRLVSLIVQGQKDRVSNRTYVIRSLRSLVFFRPPKAILVPGMYFLGFPRYSNYAVDQSFFSMVGLRDIVRTYQSIFIPGHAGLSVGIGVREAFDGT